MTTSRIVAIAGVLASCVLGCSGDDAPSGSAATSASVLASPETSAAGSTAPTPPASTAPPSSATSSAAGPTTTVRATTSTLAGAVTTERSVTTTTEAAGAASTTVAGSASGLVLAAGGVGVVSFGATAENAAVEIGDVLGPSAAGAAGECDAGPLDQLSWGSTLRIYLKDGKFAGWFTRSAELRTVKLVGVGSTRADMDAAYGAALAVQTGSLGVEWTVTPNGPSGLFSSAAADATVTAAWAGLICAAR